MSGLPNEVPWRRFVCVLRKLGYSAQKGKAGSARLFVHPSRSPEVVSFREPHPGGNLRPPMLRKSHGLRMLATLGDYFTVDTSRSFICRDHVDLETEARRLGALSEWEELVE